MDLPATSGAAGVVREPSPGGVWVVKGCFYAVGSGPVWREMPVPAALLSPDSIVPGVSSCPFGIRLSTHDDETCRHGWGTRSVLVREEESRDFMGEPAATAQMRPSASQRYAVLTAVGHPPTPRSFNRKQAVVDHGAMVHHSLLPFCFTAPPPSPWCCAPHPQPTFPGPTPCMCPPVCSYTLAV